MINPRQICFACMKELPSEDAVCPSCGHDNRLRGNGLGFLKSCVLGRQYMTGRVLGRGGFGITYLGLDLLLNRRVAIKEYFPEGVVHRDPETQYVRPFGGSMGEEFEKGRERALQEARVAAQLEGIPNTVKIYSVLEANGTIYIVMEYIDGMTLTAYVQKSGGRLSWIQTWPLIDPVLHTLISVHAKGIVHRDVSPDNIMLRYPDAVPVLLDFGTARNFTSGNTEHSVSLRLGYSPMEMYTSSGAIDQRSDEYSIMATMYFMLTGQKPESPLNVAAGIGNVEPPSKMGSDIPSGKGSPEEVMMRGLSCRMEDRYPTINELQQAFHRSLEQAATMTESSRDTKTAETKTRKEKRGKEHREAGRPAENTAEKTSEPGKARQDGRGESPQETKPVQKNKSTAAIILTVVLTIAVICGIIIFGGDKKDEQKKARDTVTDSHAASHASPKQASDEGTWTCANCNADNPFTDLFCTQCGQTKLCLQCGKSVAAGDQFCTECGTEAGKWICSGCGEAQDAENVFCVNCGTSRHTPGVTNTSGKQ